MAILMDLRIEEDSWHDIPALEPLCQRALDAGYGTTLPDGAVDVLLTDNDTLQSLNTKWRDKPRPTDILSFPAPENPENFLGDIAIAYGVAARDAASTGKSMAAHLSHLLIHGLLHLRGHDHMQEDEARIMEDMERNALTLLGIDDPYSRITAD